MKNKSRSFLIYLFADAVLFFFSYSGIYFLTIKAALPFKFSDYENHLISLNNSPDNKILKGDSVLSINGHTLYKAEEIELLLDGYKSGDVVNVKYIRESRINSTLIELTEYYSMEEVVTYTIVGSLFLLIAIFILYKCSNLKSAHVFHWVSIFTGVVLMMTPGNYTSAYGLGYLNRILFNISYSLVPAIYIHFTCIFPVDRTRLYKKLLNSFYISSAAIGVILNIIFLNVAISASDNSIKNYIIIYDIFRVYVLISIITAILIFIRSYRVAETVPEKKKLKWLLYGFLIGPFNYLLFWVLPHLLFGKSIVPELLIVLLFAAVPFTFTIAITKYHLMDIDIVINRSIVYSLVLGGLIGVYLLVITLLGDLISDVNNKLPGTVSAVIVALLFQPVKNKIQLYVNKYFFRVQYDFGKALKKLISEIKDSPGQQILAEKLVQKIDELIPVERIAYFSLKSNRYISIVAHKNFEKLSGRSIKFEEDKLKTRLPNPVALPEKVESGLDIEIADRAVFRRWGMAITFPLKTSDGALLGFLVLGEKKSGKKFTSEDIDLLNVITAEAALTNERIQLQENLLTETLEKKKLNELNEMKSFFVSNVSHDLRTPLSSIKIFTDILRNKENISSNEREKYFNIIEAESSRLERLIEGVLNFNKIEKGLKHYEPEVISLESIVKNVLEIMDYHFKINNFSVSVSYAENDNYINADKDALTEAVINILSNSIKYSGENKEIFIKTFCEKNFSNLSIEDKGIGISEENIQKIFGPYFRAGELKGKNSGGMGIGLTIVKHIMDEHNGKIEVKSKLNHGTCFTLRFPKNP